MEVAIPFRFRPRPYQRNLWKAFDKGYRRLMHVWHRRAGKDMNDLSLMARECFMVPGQYFYMYPTYEQGRKAIWEGRTNDGNSFLEEFPEELIVRKDSQTMTIELKTKEPGKTSIFKVVGSDRVDSLMSTNPRGIVFSEYSLQDPTAWDFMRPILAANGGWAIFNMTPRGNNHGKRLYEMAQREDNWYCEVLTVEDTKSITAKVLEQEKREMYDKTGSDALYMQEYYCSFDAPVPGAYYGPQMLRMAEEGRYTFVPHNPDKEVVTFWDLGVDDSRTCGMFQFDGDAINCINYREWQGWGMSDAVADVLKLPYRFSQWLMPHDIDRRDDFTGASRLDSVRALLPPGSVVVIPRTNSVEDDIDAVRKGLHRLKIDNRLAERLYDCLNAYSHDVIEKDGVYRKTPKHNWASHGADMIRYLFQGLKYVVSLQPARSMVIGYVGGDGVTGYGRVPVYAGRDGKPRRTPGTFRSDFDL